jgi:Ferritin-like domain
VNELTRSAFLRRAAAGGGAVAAGAAVGWTAGAAAGAASEQDLAWLRFAIAAEFVSVAYYRQARAAGHFAGRELRALQRATAAQVAHRRAFRTALTEQGEPAIDDADLELELPEVAFETRPATVRLGRRIEGLLTHAYLGAVTTIADQAIRRLFAQASASEADQLSFLTGLAGPPVGDAFPSVHGLETAAEALAVYLP